jgi:O-antigen/teichoic acid export membrane protein
MVGINRADEPVSGAGLRARLTRAAAGALLARALGAVAGLAAAVVLSRALGPAGYGAYAWAAAWVLGLARPAALGSALLLLRSVAAGSDAAARNAARVLATRAAVVVGLTSLAAAAVLVGVFVGLGIVNRTLAETLLVAAPALPLSALGAIPQGVLLGLNRQVAALAPSVVIQPAAVAVLVGAVWAIAGRGPSPEVAGTALAAGAALALVCGATLARRALPPGPRPRERVALGQGLAPLVPLAATDTALMLQALAGVALLGPIAGTSAAGRYAIAAQLTAPFSLVLAAVGASLSPIVAALHASGDRELMRRGILAASRVCALLGVAVAVVLVVFADPLLGLFGAGFRSAAPVLRILAIAGLVNALAPFNGTALVMTRNEAAAARAALFGLALCIALSAALIPPWGATGAAVAFLVSVSGRNAATCAATWRRLGLDTTVLGRVREGGPS